tara:strand:+ start:357 stop:602 length:246 start_codon:yes stop_codon:yes gene_type:complete
MKFIDGIIILVLILILLAISVNMFIYGRDLTDFPTKAHKKKRRDLHIRDQYPGSLDDDYESGYDSDVDASKVASIVSKQTK